MSFRARIKPEMDVEEFCSTEIINETRAAVLSMLEKLGFEHDNFITDRLLVELTKELCLARM